MNPEFQYGISGFIFYIEKEDRKMDKNTLMRKLEIDRTSFFMLIFLGVFNLFIGVFLLVKFGKYFLVQIIAEVIMAFGILFLGATKNARKDFKKSYKELFVEPFLRDDFSDVLYEKTEGFKAFEVDNFYIIESGGRIETEDYIVANFYGVNFEVVGVKIKKDIKDRQNENSAENRPDVRDIFNGFIMIIDNQVNSKTSVRVFSKSFDYRQIKIKGNYQKKVETESIEFNKNFDAFAFNDEDAFSTLKPQIIEKLITLQKMYTKVAVHFYKNKMIIAVNNNGDFLDAKSVWTKIDYDKEKEKIRADIGAIKQIIYIISNKKIKSSKFKTKI